jgi:hypothetical protein
MSMQTMGWGMAASILSTTGELCNVETEDADMLSNLGMTDNDYKTYRHIDSDLFTSEYTPNAKRVKRFRNPESAASWHGSLSTMPDYPDGLPRRTFSGWQALPTLKKMLTSCVIFENFPNHPYFGRKSPLITVK